MDTAQNSIQEPDLVAGRYRPGALLGRGGMGEVYEAEDTRLNNRKVALKIIKVAVGDESHWETNLKIFNKEAEILASLKHPGIPSVYDSFVEEGMAYLVMELVEGTNLEKVLSESKGSISETQVIAWGIEIAGILRHLHRHNPTVIFRDIKPANIILQENGSLKLVDFGIARTFAKDRKSTAFMAKGTLGYAPPEQFEEKGITDERSDIYGLGATLHHLATGIDPRRNAPFSFQPVRSHRNELSECLEYIISRCLTYERTGRYVTVEHLLRDLKTLKAGKKVKKEIRKKTREFRFLSYILVLLGIAVLGLGGFLGYRAYFQEAPLTMHAEPEHDTVVPRDLKKITLYFSAPMDTNSVEKALQVFHHPAENVKWLDNDTVCEITVTDPPLPSGFDDTVVKINDNEARDKEGRYLDNQNNPKYGERSNYLSVRYKTK